MKTRYWVAILAAALVLCLALSLWFLRPGEAAYVQVYSQGRLLHTLDLRVDTELRVESDRGRNVITVHGGKIAVTEADCPDGYCIERGFCSGGAQIVCLPNRLVIQFIREQTVDAAVG